MNHLDEWYRNLYDDAEGPMRYKDAPISLQIVGRRFQDEKLLRVLSCLRDLLDRKP
jgi:Asp-tRNA(Asn)/Glu-tRNA(Gln) amidotransferase A subunit family amidase